MRRQNERREKSDSNGEPFAVLEFGKVGGECWMLNRLLLNFWNGVPHQERHYSDFKKYDVASTITFDNI